MEPAAENPPRGFISMVVINDGAISLLTIYTFYLFYLAWGWRLWFVNPRL